MAPSEIEPARKGDTLEVEETKPPPTAPTVAHYKPANDEEKALDKRINRKLDFTVLAVLAIGFILCGIDKTNVGFVATSTFVQDANLVPDDIPNSLSLVRPSSPHTSLHLPSSISAILNGKLN